MKRILIILLVLLVAGAGFRFYRMQLRGAATFLKPPKEDIAELIEKQESEPVQPDSPDNGSPTPLPPPPPVNETDFPLTLEAGFSVSLFAKDLVNPRDMAPDPNGVMLVSRTRSNDIVALPDRDGDGKADEIVTVAEGLNQPHGLAFRCILPNCELYVGETDQVTRFRYDMNTFKADQPEKLVDLPEGGRHFTRSLLFAPPPNENELFVSIGSSCDTCFETDERRAAIWTLNVDTLAFERYALGLRNSVFMAHHPVTGRLWATDMGRDFLGDDLPPDEVNIIEEGGHYGWPLCYGKNVHDTVFDNKDVRYIRAPCSEPFEIPSHIDIPAHSAPLGLAFFGDSWPAEYQNDLLVAYQGSWNRSVPTGYKVARYDLDRTGGEIRGVTDFMDGLLRPDGGSLGRPADVLITDDSIFVSDDKAGVIYRIYYLKEPSTKASDCVTTGCSGEVCSDEEVMSTCQYKEEYICLKSATCERQPSGDCGWTPTPELTACLEEKRAADGLDNLSF